MLDSCLLPVLELELQVCFLSPFSLSYFLILFEPKIIVIVCNVLNDQIYLPCVNSLCTLQLFQDCCEQKLLIADSFFFQFLYSDYEFIKRCLN